MSHVTLLCEFDFPNWDNVTFEVQWIVDGEEAKVDGITAERVSRLEQGQDENNKIFVAGSRVSYNLLIMSFIMCCDRYHLITLKQL